MKSRKYPNTEVIVIQDVPQNIKDFMAMPEGLEKNLFYTRKLIPKVFTYINAGKSDEIVFFSEHTMNVNKRENKYYLKASKKNGLSFKDGKVNLWFGTKITEITFLEKLFEFMNWNFIEKEYYSYVTKSILEKLFKGKITNSRELLKEYCKSVRIKCSPDLLYKAIKSGTIETLSYSKLTTALEKKLFYKYAIISKNVDHFLEAWINRTENNMFGGILLDLMSQYGDILNKKIDFRWSAKRISEEHDKATEEIMEIELKSLEEYEVKYPEVTLPKEFELLRTQKRVFKEGMIMRHCVYTNYWNSIKNKTYVAFRVSLNGEEATLGCSLYTIDKKAELHFSQCYQKRNKAVSDEMRKFCSEWVENNKYIFENIEREKIDLAEPHIIELFPLQEVGMNPCAEIALAEEY